MSQNLSLSPRLNGTLFGMGLPFYGVRTTGVFCRTGCPSRAPNPENVLYFHDTDEPRRQGFRACKRCRPDLVEPEITQFQRDLTERFVQIAVGDPGKTVEEIAEQLSVSRRQLERITVLVTGFSPRRLATREQGER
jgi:methylphosphotriester-DNA--protein-cysteine methyltransferase